MRRFGCSLVLASFLASGCTYHGTLDSAQALQTTIPIKPSGQQVITLIDSGDGISSPTIQVGAFTLNYDVKASVLDVAKEALDSSFKRVDLAKTAIASNPFYAVPRLAWRQTSSSGLSAGLDIAVLIEIHETAGSRLLTTLRENRFVSYTVPESSTLVGFISGLTLCAICPITVPMALKKDGDHGKVLIQNAIIDTAATLKREVARVVATADRNFAAEDCYSKIPNDPALSIIRNKVALSGTTKQSFSMFSDDSFPTEQEKPAIARYAESWHECFQKAEDARSEAGTVSAIRALESTTETANINLLVLLHNGGINYGQFARERQKIADEYKTAYVQITRELEKKTAESEAIARQLALEAQRNNINESMAQAARMQTGLMGLQLMQSANQARIQQQMLNTINQPRILPSPSVHCNSMKIGNQIHTNCY